MSTEHQRYSIINQTNAIAEYAESHGYQVVVSYADPGKSGLSLQHRPGLKQLLADAIGASASFRAILVLDVSRWGRFQDHDQAGHYEFICRQAGKQIVYCAEPFQDDESPIAPLVKDLKRIMASEYSRELSAKVFQAKMRLAPYGFKLGGASAPYGFRRMLVDHNRVSRFILNPGQKKYLKSDHVIYVAGPREEQEIIRRIFRLYADNKLGCKNIAKLFNRTKIPGPSGRAWTYSIVNKLLKSELCIGRMVYNRKRSVLSGPTIAVPESQWVRVQIMDPIVPEDLFWKAQAERRKYCFESFSPEKVLKGLRALLAEKGSLSTAIINAEKSLPTTSTIANHFGSLEKALALIGYVRPPRDPFGIQAKRLTDDQIFQGLRRLYNKYGYVTRKLINANPALPSADHVRDRFGSIYRAYTLSGLPPVTHRQVMAAAQKRRKARERLLRKAGHRIKMSYSTVEMMRGLRRILRKHGYISARLIDLDKNMPSAAAVARRFGSHTKAYRAVGWSRRPNQVRTTNSNGLPSLLT